MNQLQRLGRLDGSPSSREAPPARIETRPRLGGRGERFMNKVVLLVAAIVVCPTSPAWSEDKGHWAFVAPERPEPPRTETRNWGRGPIDVFVLARLEAAGLAPIAEADRYTLIRRLSLDLTGLPPSPEEVREFVGDKSPDAYESLVDRLLASPAYGEKWASKWLDLARYADTNGYENDHHRDMWAFRDWVIAALNADMPYDQFTIEQIAGDLLPNATLEQRIATAFHRNTMTNVESGTDDEEFRTAAVVDRVNTTMQVWMGVTAACAACHDHKYDPLSQREYYQFFAIFNQTEDHDQKDNRPTIPTPTAEQKNKREALQKQIAEAEEAGFDSEGNPERAGKLKEELKKLQKGFARTPVMVERPVDKRRETHVHEGGSFRRKGERVEAGVPAAFHQLPDGSELNRLAFAKWLVDRRNPLTARVAVNRIWEELFGIGLVETSEDFGTQGELPSHPKLLDLLAIQFMEDGWSQKRLIKSIVLSSTYRQSAQVTEEKLAKDPRNLLLSRGPRFRLGAEVIRDQALAASGLLSGKMFGPSVMPPQPAGLWKEAFSRLAWKNSEGEDRYRRGLYTYWKRTSPYPSMIAFDATSREVCTVRRIRTNTPLSVMVTMNDPVYQECAQALARRLVTEREGGYTPESRARYAFELVLVRPPSDRELERIVGMFREELQSFRADPEAARKVAESVRGEAEEDVNLDELAAWTLVSRVLLNLDETVTKG